MVSEVGLPPVPKKPKYVHEYPDKFVSKPEDIPETEHWAIITGSRHTDSYGDTGFHIDYEVYLTKEKWERQIQYRLFGPQSGYRESFKALHVKPATLKLSVQVEVKE